MPFGPFDVEMLVNEGCTVAIDRFCQLHGFLLGLSSSLQAADLALVRAINKNMKSFCPATEVVSGPPSHDYAIAGFGYLRHDLPDDFADAFGIDKLQPLGIQAS